MSLLRQWAFLLAVIVAGAVFCALVFPKPPLVGEGEITVADAQKLENVLWIDARTAENFSREHIPGALNLNEDNWAAEIAGVLEIWTPGQPVIVYCAGASCAASRAVADRLRGAEYGLDNVRVLHGGWSAWQEAQAAKGRGAS